jgi:hypothetical protein
MWWFAECPMPGDQGLVGALRTEGGQLVLLCDSCGTVWCAPDDLPADRYDQPGPPDWPTRCGTHIRPGTTAWADRAEIDAAGWGDLPWTQA